MNNFKANEVDIYGGFTNKLATLYDENANEDEAFQNVIKNSSYGKRNMTTPKFGLVIIYWFGILDSRVLI
jgi:hypothetical protein